MQKIVIIEDDKAIMNSLSDFLIAEGYTVYKAEGQKDGTRLIRECSPDCILLDISLPDGNGFSICSDVRGYSDVPIIFLTASGDEKSVIAGLELGADDYIKKPFSPAELTARVDALIRRLGIEDDEKSSTEIQSGPFLLNTRNRTLEKNGQRLKLTQIEYMLMKLFMENPGKAMSREDILAAVWGNEFSGELKTVDVNIRRLRIKIENDPTEPEFLTTVWGYGYKWGY
jgi:DNA-binding response OmpR family regulator